MDEDVPFPEVSDALLKALRARFPDRCPDLSCPIDEVRARAGDQRVIAFLAEQHRSQNEEGNVLHPKSS